MTSIQAPAFNEPGLFGKLTSMSMTELDELDFGVIEFDADGLVQRYNAFESKAAGLSTSRVLGLAFFTVVAPCMNNYLVSQRFDDAAAEGSVLDDTIDYVLTLRMRPVKVRLRLMAEPGTPHRYVLVQRSL